MASSNDYHELCYYSLPHNGPEFIRQHVVVAIGAQEASSDATPIRLLFALVGLYLHVERGFTGREVQRAHAKLGRERLAQNCDSCQPRCNHCAHSASDTNCLRSTSGANLSVRHMAMSVRLSKICCDSMGLRTLAVCIGANAIPC